MRTAVRKFLGRSLHPVLGLGIARQQLIDRRLRRKLEPQLEEAGEGERPHVVAAE